MFALFVILCSVRRKRTRPTAARKFVRNGEFARGCGARSVCPNKRKQYFKIIWGKGGALPHLLRMVATATTIKHREGG